LFNYEDWRDEKQTLLSESLTLADNLAARQAMEEMEDAEREIEDTEITAIVLIGREKWDEALTLVTSPSYKRQRAIYRAGLSRALDQVLADSERNTDQASTLARSMQVTALAVFLLYALLGFRYNKRMRKALQTEQSLKRSLEDANAHLELRVAERTREISEKAAELREAYEVISKSIQYASRIQRAILPDTSAADALLSDYFLLWEPRDVVVGDIYWISPWGDGLLIGLGDCTGHGVPGAFVTLIATGAFERARAELQPGQIGSLLERMHYLIQLTLKQHSEFGEADDGMELGVCYLSARLTRLTYAGAGISLFLSRNGGPVEEVKGNKRGLGYRGTPRDQKYQEHSVEVSSETRLYMTTDGLIDQVGGMPRRTFGKKRFKAVLDASLREPMAKQKQRLLEAFEAHRGDERRRDDVSAVGISLAPSGR
jgi:serine phosphatase RsbU (regulator of sigma subunit)